MEATPPVSRLDQSRGPAKKPFLKTISKQKYLIFMSLPVLIWLLVFQYVPLAGWALAFFEYKPGMSLGEMNFVGFKYFVELFGDERFYNALRNTVIMSFLQISLAGFILPILFALFINEMRSVILKRSVQTISYLPHFVSWVVVSGIFIKMLSPSDGIINEVLLALNLIQEPINFMAEPKYFYAISTLSESWKELGWNAIIYIAAIAGVDQEQYEAATVDGCGRFKKMWHVTLPSIRPTIVILLIINAGALVHMGIEKPLLLSNGLNMDKAEVLDMYALNYGIGLGRFGFGTAVGIFGSIVSITLVFLANYLSKKTTDDSIV